MGTAGKLSEVRVGERGTSLYELTRASLGGIGFEPFWSENGYRFGLFSSEMGYIFLDVDFSHLGSKMRKA